ncbi:MAG TPA: ABC transporter permease, partial [Gammaproteobacteria bacterium]|nr:ABC transporter permease [Gammaproteobacteria bacterium]
GGASAQITAELASLGKNLLIVTPGSDQSALGVSLSAAPFNLNDAKAIEQEISNVTAVSASAIKTMRVVYGSKNRSTTITGTDSAFFKVKNWPINQGRPFSEAELLAGKPVCILGTIVRDALFGLQNPLGASIRLGKLSCEVIGVLKSKGGWMTGINQDDLVVMPLQTFQRRIAGNRDVGIIYVEAASGEVTAEVKRNIELVMRERRHLQQNAENDFEVDDLTEIVNTVARTYQILTTLVGAIAAVSLVVGGIGIMNIMLVSVTERTREIGSRLAIGAREKEVLMQFLVEAIVLASFEGIAGMLLGLVGSAIAAHFLEIPFIPNLAMVIIAFLFSGAVGVIFGYFPAHKAARLNPIDALRHE